MQKQRRFTMKLYKTTKLTRNYYKFGSENNELASAMAPAKPTNFKIIYDRVHA